MYQRYCYYMSQSCSNTKAWYLLRGSSCFFGDSYLYHIQMAIEQCKSLAKICHFDRMIVKLSEVLDLID